LEDGTGIEIGCLAKGISEGWAVTILRDRAVPPEGATGNNKDWQPQGDVQRNLLYVRPKETRQVSPQRALREILDRVASESDRHIY
jgi:hypothetical protein